MGTQGLPHPMGKSGRPNAPRVPVAPPSFASGPPSVNTKQVGVDGPLSKPTALVFVSGDLNAELKNRIPEVFPPASLVFLPFRLSPGDASSQANSGKAPREGNVRRDGRAFRGCGAAPYESENSRASGLRDVDSVRSSNRCQGPAVAGWHVNLHLKQLYERCLRDYGTTDVGEDVDDIWAAYTDHRKYSKPSANELMKMVPFLGGCLCHGLATRGTFLGPNDASGSGQKSVQVQIQKITRLLNVFMVTDPTQRTHPSDPVYLMIVQEDDKQPCKPGQPFVGMFGICDNGWSTAGETALDRGDAEGSKLTWQTVVALFRNAGKHFDKRYTSSTPVCIGRVQHPPECQLNQCDFNKNVMQYWMLGSKEGVINNIKEKELNSRALNSITQRLRHVAVDLRL